ncbi:hypothetical protein CROQUDRAFT_95398 [Cronartium quercuum f. sp. fusiforme G11]|uniref:Uncharacterized protein n=1 Tax=Cronartium quercuum f. sp. fusiforme G11 TaxID=708437 RepID=A0A9P6TA11_9BASI|nr:hypothetical protein CROQUDRAFT_95398 [Cronartium quercuum f. sp. fusiforme G11]
MRLWNLIRILKASRRVNVGKPLGNKSKDPFFPFSLRYPPKLGVDKSILSQSMVAVVLQCLRDGALSAPDKCAETEPRSELPAARLLQPPVPKLSAVSPGPTLPMIRSLARAAFFCALKTCIRNRFRNGPQKHFSFRFGIRFLPELCLTICSSLSLSDEDFLVFIEPSYLSLNLFLNRFAFLISLRRLSESISSRITVRFKTTGPREESNNDEVAPLRTRDLKPHCLHALSTRASAAALGRSVLDKAHGSVDSCYDHV